MCTMKIWKSYQELWIHYTNVPWRLCEGLTSSIPLHSEASAGIWGTQPANWVISGKLYCTAKPEETATTISSLTVRILYWFQFLQMHNSSQHTTICDTRTQSGASTWQATSNRTRQWNALGLPCSTKTKGGVLPWGPRRRKCSPNAFKCSL